MTPPWVHTTAFGLLIYVGSPEYNPLRWVSALGAYGDRGLGRQGGSLRRHVVGTWGTAIAGARGTLCVKYWEWGGHRSAQD